MIGRICAGWNVGQTARASAEWRAMEYTLRPLARQSAVSN